MLLEESIFKYKEMAKVTIKEDLSIIQKTCRALLLKQKVMSFAFYLYYAAKDTLRIEPDDPILLTAVINLACKAFESIRPLDKIFEHICKNYDIQLNQDIFDRYLRETSICEVDICEGIDFNFNMVKIYQNLETRCKLYKLDSLFSKKCWVMLNDTLRTPISIYFTEEEIIDAIFFLNFFIQESSKSNTTMTNSEVYSSFTNLYNITTDLRCLEFIAFHILEMY